MQYYLILLNSKLIFNQPITITNLQDIWIGLLHHVCNNHEGLGSKYTHPEGTHDENLPWFDRRDNDFVEVQKVILNPEMLESFKYYTRLRYKLLKF